MLPLLAVNLLAYSHIVTLPESMAWLGTMPTMILLSVAAVTETIVHFIPAAGTGLKAMATPLAFVAGTLLMAVPLGNHNPLYQWTIAAVMGGGVATLTHLGVTGARAMTEPASLASFGLVGVVWNIGEFLVSILFAGLSGLCLLIGWVVGAIALFALVTLAMIVGIKGFKRWSRPHVTVA